MKSISWGGEVLSGREMGSVNQARLLVVMVQGRRVIRSFPPGTGTPMEPPLLCGMQGGVLGVSELEKTDSIHP